jgi:hypothetical protein
MRPFRLAPEARSRDAHEAYLNALGADGWAIVSVAFDDEYFIGVAK